MPEASVDPVVMAAATVLRLQTVVSREVAPADSAVVTIGALQAGSKENVIPDEALIKLNVRTFDEGVRARVLAAIRRIVNAEAEASGAPRPPTITELDHYSLVTNDPAATARIRAAFRSRFPEGQVVNIPPISASEDFGSFGSEWRVPSVFWTVGGTDPAAVAAATEAGTLAELPTNHNPRFAPVLHPTLETGIHTMVTAALEWLGHSPDGTAPTPESAVSP
jgi:hippurate hydrolase